MIFYPTPMFVSLVTHGLQAVLISLLVRHVLKSKPLPSAIVAAVLGLYGEIIDVHGIPPFREKMIA